MLKVLSVILIFALGLVPTFAQDTSTPLQQSFYVCEWGLIVIQSNTDEELFDITITSPNNFTGIVNTLFTVNGTGKGLFEANLVVEVIDITTGKILFTEPTLVNIDELGGEGDWSIDIDLSEVDSVTPIRVHAYSTEPEQGSIITEDEINLNLNSEFGLPFVNITRPISYQGVSTSPLLVEGTAGALFENTLNIQILNELDGEILAETFATIETGELAGQGGWSTTIDLDIDTGESFVVYAFEPSVTDDDTITVDDTQFGIASPLALTYERILVLQAGDPITFTDDLCADTQAEFDNTNISPLIVTDVNGIATMSMTPLLNLTI